MSQKNSQIGAMGEHMVIAQLMQQGWAAFNANSSITNMKSIDIICLNEQRQTALIQVKTTREASFPVGLSMEKAKDIKAIEEHIIGPWVFVKATGDKENTKYTYYILTKTQVRDLIYQSNDWYLHKLKRAKAVSENGTCAVREEWLEGTDFIAKTLDGPIGKNPLNGAITKGAWNNIWK